MGAIQFIESLDRTNLSITDEEFDKNVEAAVSAFAERADSPVLTEKPAIPSNAHNGESSQRSAGTSRKSIEVQRTSEKSPQSSEFDDEPSVTGLLRTIQKPLTSIGRIFSDDQYQSDYPPAPRHRSQHASHLSNQIPEQPRRLSPAVFQPPRNSMEEQERLSTHALLNADEAAVRQASAEAAEARRIQRAEHKDIVE